MIYTYPPKTTTTNKQAKKPQRLTDKDTTSKLKHSRALTLKTTVKQYHFTLCTSIQTIQLTLSNIHTQEES